MESKRKLDWLTRIGIGLILINVLLLIYMTILGFICFRKIEMPVVFYTNYDYHKILHTLGEEFEPIYQWSSNKQLKVLIEEESSIKFYIYCEKDLSNGGGYALPSIRTILVDNNIEGYVYCRVFTHEVMHIQRYSLQEDYIGFETFKFLYESKNKELHNYGVLYGIKQLEGEFNGREDECRDQIIGYLRSKTA